MPSFYKRQGLLRAPGVLAAVIITTALVAGCAGGGSEQTSPPSTPLIPRAPTGPIAFPFTFGWSGAGPTDVVRVTVVDAAERQLMEFDARGASVAMPSRLSELVRPGESFSWKVAAVGEAGEAIRASEWAPATREK